MKKNNRRSFTLLEIVIGLTLLSIVITLLFQAMSNNAAMTVKLEEVRARTLQRQHLQTRIFDLFLSLASERPTPFYTLRFPGEKGDSLIVLFNNEIDPDPRFSGIILGRLFLDEKHNLSLATWPLEPANTPLPWRKEILCTEVETINFTYYGKSPDTSLAWQHHWPKSLASPPLMIRLRLKQPWGTASFAWTLCHTSQKV